VDINSEHSKQGDARRQLAAAYAEHMVAETMVPSNPATLAPISRVNDDGAKNILKNLVMPFSTFSITSHVRHIQDLNRLARNPNFRNATAVAGDLAEVAAFAGTSYAIAAMWKPLIKAGIEQLTGVDAPDNEEKREASRKKALRSTVMNQLIPTSVGAPGEAGTSYMVNQIARIIQDPDKPYNEWKKETGGFVFESDEVDYGLYSIGLNPLKETIQNVKDVTNVIQGDPVEYESFGQTREANLDSPQKNILYIKTIMDAAANMGVGEADIYNEIRRIYQEQQKEASSTQTILSTPSNRKPVRQKRIRRQPTQRIRE
jgi:hypothetical protein